MIDEALEEIERTELEMLDLLSDVLGSEEARRVAEHIAGTQREHRLTKLRRDARDAGAST